MIFEKRRKHLDRYVEIGRILARHEWKNMLGQIGLARQFHIQTWGKGVLPSPEQIREGLEDLGPAFVKLGQILSTRPDLIPTEYIAELEKLQDQAKEVPITEIRQVIESDFGKHVEEIFLEFDETPLAAASLGQTHLARLSDGRQVVVKIQRPGIRQQIDTDLEIIAGVAQFLERRWEAARTYGVSDVVEEFNITLHQELDYTREGRHGDLLKENLSGIGGSVRVAETIWDYSTPRVLTAERISGVKITDLEEIDRRGYDRKVIARNLWRAFLHMIFLDGFFHGDPHPGNLVVLDNNVIGLLDYGMVGRLDRHLKTQMTLLIGQYVEQDSAGVAEMLLAMGTIPSNLNRRRFAQDMDRLLRQYYGAPIGQVQMGDALSRSVRLTTKYRVRLPASLGLLVKVIIGVEGINRCLDPDYDMTEEARPFIARSIQREFSPHAMSSDLVQSMIHWKQLLVALPDRTSQIMERVAEGNLRIVFHHEGLEEPIKDMDRSANRLSFALIASAITVASSVVLSAGVGPKWNGYSLIGVIGFVISLFFGIWLMVSIIRSEKLW